MSDVQNRPILVLLASHWLSMLGSALVTLAGFSWLFVLPAHVRGEVGNPYIGLLVFIAIPAVFILGLILIPIGVALGKRRVAAGLATFPEARTAWRRAAVFFGVMTVANIVIASQASYGAIAHMETVQFCGQTCHVMKPEFTAHLREPHQAVACVECHVSPGATGWLKSKMSGTRQLLAVSFNTYPRPIESAMESNRLVSSADTCEHCHSREKPIGDHLRILTKFKGDEANTRTYTVLSMNVGGGSLGGIHGAHLGPGVHIRYAAGDRKRQTIPWVEYSANGESRQYLAPGAKPDASLPVFEMQCVDCHNRAAHSFETAEHAVDDALASGRIARDLPFVKKTSLALVQQAYASGDDAAAKIPAGLAAYYRDKYPDVAARRAAEIQSAGQALAAIYQRNVFPDLKVAWGTYPNNLGHMDAPGCFRCHDGDHTTADKKKSITQDCSTCHESLAVEEESPAILKSLGK
jgi:hypothetical protein